MGVIRLRKVLRIFLDTNIIITGAFNPFGPSAALDKVKEKVQFITSHWVIGECKKNIERKTSCEYKRAFATNLITVFIDLLNVKILEDIEINETLIEDKDDQLIHDTACHFNCDYICTYNLVDFRGGNVEAKTPLYLLQIIQTDNFNHFVQLPILSRRGSMIFMGQLHHKSSLSTVLKSGTNIHVFTTPSGEISINGTGVRSSRVIGTLKGGEPIALSFRFNNSYFEAASWVKKDNEWEKELLTTAQCTFSENTDPHLFFKPNHKFFGHVKNVSGIPRYVKDKDLIFALENRSLESRVGSLDLKYVLDKTKIDIINSQVKVSYPVRKE